jgi:glycosyltransferase involved in cell wall biosynthesis
VDNALDLQWLYAVPGADVRAEFGIPAHIPVGITIGGLRYEKGTDFLLDVVERVDSPFRVLVVGPDADLSFSQRSREDAARRGLMDKLIFTGRRADAPALMQGCDFALMPSRSESGPLVLIEYMAIGLPFVSTMVGGIPKRAYELGAQKFVPFGDAGGFAHEVDTLLKLPAAERRARGQAGKLIADKHFNMRSIIAQWYTIYDRLLSCNT